MEQIKSIGRGERKITIWKDYAGFGVRYAWTWHHPSGAAIEPLSATFASLAGCEQNARTAMRERDDHDATTRADIAAIARTLGSRGGRADSPAQREQRARVMGHGRPVVARASYRSSATLRASQGYQIALAEAEALREHGAAGEPGARRTQVMDTIDGLVGRHTGTGRMAWPREIVLAAHLA